jgi:Mg2+ and Co2+ transporter CorA
MCDSSLSYGVKFETIKKFVRQENSRGHRPQIGEYWIRIRPPNKYELEFLKENPDLHPLFCTGAKGKILEIDNHVLICVGGDSMMFSLDVFLETFIRIIDFPGTP